MEMGFIKLRVKPCRSSSCEIMINLNQGNERYCKCGQGSVSLDAVVKGVETSLWCI